MASCRRSPTPERMLAKVVLRADLQVRTLPTVQLDLTAQLVERLRIRFVLNSVFLWIERRASLLTAMA